MANDVIFEDYTINVIGAIDDKIDVVLEECAGELEAATKRRNRVDTGKTKSSWRHVVENHEAIVGSADQNAIWEEFGTGEHALQGNGRKGGWAYQDAKGEWHFTHGKKPRRALHNAYKAMKMKIINKIQESFKGL